MVTTPRVRAELMAQAPDGVVPGQSVWVGLQLQHRPGWHTYWKNAGDSGLPTQLQWTLPAGVTAGDIAWPVPQKIRIGTLANYGYEGTVLLPVPLTIAPNFKPPLFASSLEVKLKASWLVCRTECIPEDGNFVLKIPLKGSTALDHALFDAALAAHPKPLTGSSQVEIAGNTLKVSVAGLPATLTGQTLELFPETSDVIDNAAPITQTWQGKVWTAQVPISSLRDNSPAVMPLVLATRSAGTVTGYRTEAKVLGHWPKLAAAATVSPALDAALQANAAAGANAAKPAGLSNLAAALLGALLGGLILNLMPCVFPILAIKVVGFTRHASDRRAHRISALAYTVGVLASFLALGGLLLALRAGGEQLGWGFQLQSPFVVASLAVLFTVIGLNLAGLFEFGRFLPSGLAALEARHPVVNSFLSGVLAVAIASPCTAPFMGAALGFAVGLPAMQALAVFGAIGLGMALPYL
ncbi:MAG: protein-disulfide reductase DsbD domain-containing protein, partial [Rhodoferax sp.]